ncbi:uncharacterized protein L3040_007405 [Drepanopeziza brunnea f. sp. 'multigermtubi']|uniref:Bgh specific protein n=1 Tax=Marssonina brunnea f. sp. multigermtubi (strain MB_m1) TaxID=1072389 RepID=K1WLI7_MARBU|nr:uncharacterized protein MBM_03568 [Drepanopeziza brunnea f. sp. 'multigermtubi' MB_m1]EKD18575.1 hypothetical protein MBM_03568 [Drepanopeziza brunnea f. sp. 'multigermtubi' MB_m1]KAJ5037228.1 hypothetical protein L3040_007405 [Drepanopeziza brunnea f. sp. 'multigermtubi']
MTDTLSNPPLGSENTLQRLLDQEQKNKIERIKASFPSSAAYSASPSFTFPLAQPSSISQPGLALSPGPKSMLRRSAPPRLPIKSIGRAVTTPFSSVAPAPLHPSHTKPTSNGTSTKYLAFMADEGIPQGGEANERGSDTSSICQSPGWEHYNANKQQKSTEVEGERRKREPEVTSPQAREGKRSEGASRKRLSKPPPTSKRLTQMVISPERSMSAPAVPGLPYRQGMKERKKTVSGKDRRASVDTSRKAFIPWKSSPNSPSTPPANGSSRKSFAMKPTVDDGGFMGGLKLEQLIIRQQNTSSGDEAQLPPVLQNDRNPDPRKRANIRSSSTSMADSSQHPSSLHEDRCAPAVESVRDSDSPVAPVSLPPSTGHDIPPSEGNIPTGGRPHPPSSSRHFPDAKEAGSPERDSVISLNPGYSDLQDVEDGPKHGRAASMASPPAAQSLSLSSERAKTAQRPALKKSYPPDSGARASYVRHQQQESEAKAIMALQDADADAAKNPRGRRASVTKVMAYVRSRSRSRQPSQDLATSAGQRKLMPDKKSAEKSRHEKKSAGKSRFMSEDDVIKQLHHELSTKSPDGHSNQTRTRSSSSKRPSFQGFRNAAISAFSRHSSNARTASPSSEKSFATARESQSSSKASSSKRASIELHGTSDSTLRKAEDVFPEVASPPPGISDSGVNLATDSRAPESRGERVDMGREQIPANVLPESHAQSNHPRSATTDSSEDYSTLDDSSNVTTPAASRPNSQKNNISERSERGHLDHQIVTDTIKNTTITLIEATPKSPVLKSAFSFEEGVDSVAPPSCGRAGVELEATKDEDQMKLPTGEKASTDLQGSQPTGPIPNAPRKSPSPPVPPIPVQSAYIADLQRKPSMSRSWSTPELQQDLSFLPALKHQPLPRPRRSNENDNGNPKGKENEATPSKLPVTPLVSKYSPPVETPLKTLSRPPTTVRIGSPPPPNSEGSSPAPSNYLQNARLSLPRSQKTIFPSSTFSPHHQIGPDPIAKMLVVCCSCKYFHDMPSKVYECMTKPYNVVTDRDRGVSGVVSTAVKCPWCGHGMSTACCAGYAAMVYLKERLH